MTLISPSALMDSLRQYRLVDAAHLAEATQQLSGFTEPKAFVGELIRRGWLTAYQANHLLQGRAADLLLGSYVLLGRVGEGGMGEVFKARNWKLGKVVALKLIRKEKLLNADAVRRFQREVRAVAALSHPNIVLAYDADQVGGAWFLVMEHIDGATDLSRLLKQNGPLPIEQACEYIRQAALGLQHAAERGLVHRDIKPANLLLTPDGKTVKILDMGLARLSETSSEQQSTFLTQEGVIMGTPDYIAPEQALHSHTVDIRADLYSLGCSFYQLLTGRVPFPGGALTEKLLRHQLEEPQPVEQLRPDVPPNVAAIVRKLLEKKRDNRFQTPAEVAAALGACGSAGLTPAASPTPVPLADPPVPTPAPGTEPAAEASEETLTSALAYMAKGGSADASVPRQQRETIESRRLMYRVALGCFVLLALVGGLGLIHHHLGNKEPPPNQEGPRLSEFEAWSNQVAALPPAQQVIAVAARLRKHNPGFDGNVKHEIDGHVVARLEFLVDHVTDLTLVQALRDLKFLSVSGSAPGKGKLSDLSPLRDMNLTALVCRNTEVADLKPLAELDLAQLDCSATRVTELSPVKKASLRILYIADTKIADLSPLRGSKTLVDLRINRTPVTDLSMLEGMKLSVLHLAGTRIADLSMLKGLPLTSVNLARTAVSDLSLLKGKALTELDFSGTAVSDLAPLVKMKLKRLNCSGTLVASLWPLKGMPLTSMACASTHVADLAPLKGMKLTHLDCGDTLVPTLEPLRGMPLVDLRCGGTRITTIGPLWNSKVAYVDISWTRVGSLWELASTPVTRLLCAGTPVADLGPLKDKKLTELDCRGTKVSNLWPLAKMKLLKLNCRGTPVADLSHLKNMKLTELDCAETKVSNLTPLKGMPLTTLNCSSTPVSDLGPLKGMKLKGLLCAKTKVSTLAPLQGMPLTNLNCSSTLVSDLSPLRGMPLLWLHCGGAKVKDLSPLKALPLETLYCDYDPKRDDPILRSIKTLKSINGRAPSGRRPE
jgi:serine/threonine protein kinase/Leucine-rich repeat (LRR) protein